MQFSMQVVILYHLHAKLHCISYFATLQNKQVEVIIKCVQLNFSTKMLDIFFL